MSRAGEASKEAEKLSMGAVGLAAKLVAQSKAAAAAENLVNMAIPFECGESGNRRLACAMPTVMRRWL